MTHAYSLAWFDPDVGLHGTRVVKRFDTMFEAASYMQQLLQEDQRIEQIVLQRRWKPSE
jgi:hypothetical protein